jgi:predicted acylesterase/phospholipase RssA
MLVAEATDGVLEEKAPRFIFRLDFFRWRSLTSLREAASSREPKGKKTFREHAAGGLMCGDHLASVIQANVGQVTFQEAFDRTGRILNIPVKQHDPTSDASHILGFAPPRLLNYLTAPHVLVWSASRASCAVPGIYKPSPLLVRAADGSVEFEGPTVRFFIKYHLLPS